MPTLKELRGQQLLSQAELAKKAGISLDTVNQVENGRQKPSFLTICKLAAALGVEPGEIEFGAVKKPPPAPTKSVAEAEVTKQQLGKGKLPASVFRVPGAKPEPEE